MALAPIAAVTGPGKILCLRFAFQTQRGDYVGYIDEALVFASFQARCLYRDAARRTRGGAIVQTQSRCFLGIKRTVLPGCYTWVA
jgi:hypothetical protein